MKKVIIILSLSIFALSAYADSGEDSLLALKGKNAFEYEKLYRKNLVVHNCAKDGNITTKQGAKEPKRCKKHYDNMISSINKDFGIPGVTAKDINSDRVNKHINQEVDKYMNQHLNEFMNKKDINS